MLVSIWKRHPQINTVPLKNTRAAYSKHNAVKWRWLDEIKDTTQIQLFDVGKEISDIGILNIAYFAVFIIFGLKNQVLDEILITPAIK